VTRPLLATYRVQFNPGFRFADAEALVPYFAALGISHLYASPIFAARPGSTHGYDVTDPNRISDELGGEAGFRSLVAALHAAGLGVMIDIVPNHMAADRSNAFWMEALSFGPESASGRLFDVDWSGKVVCPLLGDTLHAVLERGEIALEADFERGFLLATYYDNAVALRPATVADLLDRAGLGATAALWRPLDEAPEAEGIATARAALAGLDEGQRESLRGALAAADVASVLEAQRWIFTHWRASRDALSHRRFFNITDLVGIRVEDPEVFAATHRLILNLVRDGSVDALRVDHIDGLANPGTYARRLRAAAGEGVPIFVEKILGPRESLRDWPVEGTTGYERLNDINGLFIDEAGYRALDAHLRERRLVEGEVAERIVATKREILADDLAAEVEHLADAAAALAAPEPAAEFGRETLRRAAIALIAHLPVYRIYATARGGAPEDDALRQHALEGVRGSEDPWTIAAAEFLAAHLAEDGSDAARAFRTRFQQLSGPAMAKGYEDTLLYRSNALLSANEVGGDIQTPWRSPAAFHAANIARAEAGHPLDLVPLATHDTKRGPETRARLNVLSEMPQRFIAAAARWREMNARLRDAAAAEPAPDELDEWSLYQTLYAAWPIPVDRLRVHLEKAMREAKRKTRWEAPNAAYEATMQAFAAALVEAPQAAPFRAELAALVAQTVLPTRLAAIAQLILQLTIPGVADTYRGTELWDFSLVDPDNRRPVDWDKRKALLGTEAPPLDEDDSGAAKLVTLRAVLALRKRHADLVRHGSYEPLALAESPARWLGFRRRHGSAELLVVVPTRVTAGGFAAPLGLGAELHGDWRDAIRGAVRLGAETALDPAWPFLVAVRP